MEDSELSGEISYQITTEVKIKAEDEEEEYENGENKYFHNQIEVLKTVKEENVEGKHKKIYDIKEDKLNSEHINATTKEKLSSRSKIDLIKKVDCSEHNQEEFKSKRPKNCENDHKFDINILKSDDTINKFRLEVYLDDDSDEPDHIIQKEEKSEWEIYKEKVETEEYKENASDEAKPPKKGRYKCAFCSKTFTVKQNRRRHMIQFHESNEKSYVCDCGKEFNTRRYLQYHSKFYCNHVQPKTMTHLCHLCPRRFQNAEYLRKHVKTIHNRIKLNKSKEPLICDYCQKEYRYKFNLMRHIHQTHMGNVKGSFDCEYCEKTFKRSSILNKHLITHETEKQFKCKKCYKKFKSKWGCINHQKNCIF